MPRLLLVCVLASLAAACGSRVGDAIDAGPDGRLDGTGPGVDGAAPYDVPTGLPETPLESLAPIDVADSAGADGRDVDDAGTDASDARNFGDSGLTCGRRVLDFEWQKALPMGQWTVYQPPMVDTAANELLLPFDSGVFDDVVSATNYFLEFDLSIDGNLTFFVSPYATFGSEKLPSISRVGSDLVLAAITPGATATQVGGGFQGQHIPAQRVHVVLFAEPYTEALGMKVVAGAETFWSGFTIVERPPQDLKLVAASLPAEAGTTARIHIRPVTKVRGATSRTTAPPSTPASARSTGAPARLSEAR